MKNFKRIILVGTIVLGALAVTACGSDKGTKSTNTETKQQITSEIVDETETSEMVFDSYADVVTFMHTPEYIVDTEEYSEDAVSLMYKLVSTMMLEKDQSFDMTELTEEQREKFNYNLLNEGFGYGFIPETTDVVTDGPVGVRYDTEELNSYLSAFYEGGKVGEASNNLLQQYEQYTVYMPSDAAERHTFLRYGMYQYGEYQKFDMELGIDSTQDMGRSIDYKEIICYDVILEGNVAKFESVEEWYYPDYGYSDEKVEVHNGFYGEFTIQEDGSLILTYDVKDDSDGWILNHSLEPITLK